MLQFTPQINQFSFKLITVLNCPFPRIATADDVLSPGCLFHANDDTCIQTFDYMINKSQKEVMFDLYNKLSKIDVQKSPGLKTLLKVTAQSVEKIITASKGTTTLILQGETV